MQSYGGDHLVHVVGTLHDLSDASLVNVVQPFFVIDV